MKKWIKGGEKKAAEESKDAKPPEKSTKPSGKSMRAKMYGAKE